MKYSTKAGQVVVILTKAEANLLARGLQGGGYFQETKIKRSIVQKLLAALDEAGGR